jgi:hypothetical protein
VLEKTVRINKTGGSKMTEREAFDDWCASNGYSVGPGMNSQKWAVWQAACAWQHSQDSLEDEDKETKHANP